MPEFVIYTQASSERIRRAIEGIPRALAGKVEAGRYYARQVNDRLGLAFFSLVKADFITKSRGGTGAAGIAWPPLSPRTLAYGRPKSRDGQIPAVRRAGKLAPGGKDGFLTKAQLKLWKQVFRASLGRLAAKMDVSEAKSIAAAKAWTAVKRAGAKTKLKVFGERQHEVLRDTGILFNSLSPGAGGAGAVGSPEQIQRPREGDMLVGTSARHSAVHHFGSRKRGIPQRRLWPEGHDLPKDWTDELYEQAGDGVAMAAKLIAQEAAK